MIRPVSPPDSFAIGPETNEADPCRGWPLATEQPVDPCDCHRSPWAKGSRRPHGEEERPDPCEDFIRRILENGSRHKPKRPPHLKLLEACERDPIKDPTIPLLMLLLRRHLDKVPTDDPIETKLRDWLTAQGSKIDDLIRTWESYRQMPDKTRNCVFETRFDNWPDRCNIDWDFVGRAFGDHAIRLGRRHLFNSDSGLPGRGGPRPWPRPVAHGYEGVKEFSFLKTEEVNGPWPWICAVSTDANAVQWFRNEQYRVPAKWPHGSIDYKDVELRKVCPPWAPGQQAQECDTMTAYSAPVKGAISSVHGCPGGIRYRGAIPVVGDVCVVLPPATPGSGITLRGLNFLSTKCKVRMRRVRDATLSTQLYSEIDEVYWADGDRWLNPDPSVPLLDIDCNEVFADTQRPPPEATCNVEEKAHFALPLTYDGGQGSKPDLPPGIYELRLMVPNEDKFAFEAWLDGEVKIVVPDYLWSNAVFLEMLPRADLNYQWVIEEAFCHRSTSGPGRDEPWVSISTQTSDPTKNERKGPIYVIRAENIDSGWAIPLMSTPAVIHQGPLAVLTPELSPTIVTCQVIGIEVDSESAAKEQMNDSAAIFFEFVAQAMGPTTGVAKEGYSWLVGAIGKTWTIGAIGVGIAGLLTGGLFYALWAPADPIIADFLVLDPLTAYRVTYHDTSALAEYSKVFEGIHVYVVPMPFEQTDFYTGRSVEEHRYYSPEEKSHYWLTFRISRI